MKERNVCSICHEAVPQPHHYHVSCVSKLHQEIASLKEEIVELINEMRVRGEQ